MQQCPGEIGVLVIDVGAKPSKVGNLGVIDNHGTVHLGPYMYINVGLESIGEYREFTAGVVVRLFLVRSGVFPTIPYSNPAD